MNRNIQHITFEELERWRTEGKPFQLVDVREPEEHEAFNIGGQLIPLEDILKHQDQFDSSQPIVVYCKRGVRSQIAIQKLANRLPEADFYNLRDGILPIFRNLPQQ